MSNKILNIGKNEAAEFFSPLQSRINKGDMGRVLLVCGSYDAKGTAMCGAAYFAAKSAYLCGSGIVEIFTPRENYSALSVLVPEAVFSLYGYDEDSAYVMERLAASLKKSDAVVLGCGLGRSEMAMAAVRCVIERVDCPLVIDADALNILAEKSDLWEMLSEEQRSRTVITPHPGEMSRLTGWTISEILEDTARAAGDFARERRVVCLLKDHCTAICDGEIVYINQSGNAGMATAGMGDVLAGIIGAILARNSDNGDFLRRVATAAYLHGLAGDLAAARLGQYSLTSGEILVEISAAIREIFG